MFVPALHNFFRNREGNVAIIFALALVPMIFLTGMAMDYTLALRKSAQLEAAADAAALAAVTPAMMAQPDATAIAAATNLFNAKASNITGLNYSGNNLSVTATDNGLNRTVTVSYTASSQNTFPGILGKTAWPLSGSSQASSTVQRLCRT